MGLYQNRLSPIVCAAGRNEPPWRELIAHVACRSESTEHYNNVWSQVLGNSLNVDARTRHRQCLQNDQLYQILSLVGLLAIGKNREQAKSLLPHKTTVDQGCFYLITRRAQARPKKPIPSKIALIPPSGTFAPTSKSSQ